MVFGDKTILLALGCIWEMVHLKYACAIANAIEFLMAMLEFYRQCGRAARVYRIGIFFIIVIKHLCIIFRADDLCTNVTSYSYTGKVPCIQSRVTHMLKFS